MKYWKAGIIFFIGLLLQISFMNALNIGGYTPNLLLCLVVVFSFLYDRDLYGPLYGAVFGILYDICLSYIIGPTPLALLAASVIVILLREYANYENIISMWVVSSIAFVAYYLVNWALYRIAGNPLGLVYALSGAVWPMVYSLVVITPMYMIMIKKVEKYRGDRRFK